MVLCTTAQFRAMKRVMDRTSRMMENWNVRGMHMDRKTTARMQGLHHTQKRMRRMSIEASRHQSTATEICFITSAPDGMGVDGMGM